MHLDKFQWGNEWVDAFFEEVYPGAGADGLTWGLADEASGASQGLSGRNVPRAASARARKTANQPTSRKRKHFRKAPAPPSVPMPDDDNDMLEDEDEEED